MMYVTINVNGNPSDDELKKRARQESMNGEYVTWICRGCGGFGSSPEGRTENAKIVDRCKGCINKENLK